MTNKNQELLRCIEEKSWRMEAIASEEADALLKLDKSNITKLFEISRSLKERTIGKHITFYFTSRWFPSISVTGNGCSLKCKHCHGLLLNGLHWCESNEEVIALCKSLNSKVALGCLLTGGCKSDGTVPIDNFVEAIESVKENTDLILIAHTGLIGYDKAKKLSEAGLDGVSIDIVGESRVSENVYGIRIQPQKYIKSLIALQRADIRIISPHVCVGLDFGRLSHELKALEIISSIVPTTVEIIALMPLRGTPMEKVRPDPVDVAKVIAVAQLMFPTIPITLGCTHSIGHDRYRIEKFAIEAGVTNIASPAPRVKKTAREHGYKINYQFTCCAIPYDKKLWRKEFEPWQP